MKAAWVRATCPKEDTWWSFVEVSADRRVALTKYIP